MLKCRAANKFFIVFQQVHLQYVNQHALPKIKIELLNDGFQVWNLFHGAIFLGSILSFGKVADWMYLLEMRDFICNMHVRSLEGIHSRSTN